MAQSSVYGGRLGYQPHTLSVLKRRRIPLDSDQVYFLIGKQGRYARHGSTGDPTLPAVPEFGQLERDMPPAPGKTPQRKMGEAVAEYIVERAKKALSKEAGNVVVKVSVEALLPGASNDVVRQADINFGARGLPATAALKEAIAEEYEKRVVKGWKVGDPKVFELAVSEATKAGGTEAGKLVQDIVLTVYKALVMEQKQKQDQKQALEPEKPIRELSEKEPLTAVTQAPSSATAQPEPPAAQSEASPTSPAGGSLVDSLVGFVRTPVGIVGTIAVAYLLLRKKGA